MFALITAEARRNGGDVGAAITAAVGWIADQLPVFALNLILATADDLWALRFPATHELYVLERPATAEHLEVRSPRIHTQLAGAGRVRVGGHRQRADGRRDVVGGSWIPAS